MIITFLLSAAYSIFSLTIVRGTLSCFIIIMHEGTSESLYWMKSNWILKKGESSFSTIVTLAEKIDAENLITVITA